MVENTKKMQGQNHQSQHGKPGDMHNKGMQHKNEEQEMSMQKSGGSKQDDAKHAKADSKMAGKSEKSGMSKSTSKSSSASKQKPDTKRSMKG